MTIKTFSIYVAIFLMMIPAAAGAEVPTISSAWAKTELSRDECHTRARAVFQSKKFTRIETVQNTTFADRGRSQFGVRCVPDQKMFYVFGGAPGNDDKQLEKLIEEIRDEFNRS